MSRFETSKFVRDPAVMNQTCLVEACKILKWQYKIIRDELCISDLGDNLQFGGEYAIKVKGNQVTYNTYYLGNAASYVEKLKSKFYELNIEYSKTSIITAFKNKGFNVKVNDQFKPNSVERISFYMVGRSKDKTEAEPVGQIKFTILSDGTVISDSNYLPGDVNKLAHEAMDNIDINFASKRIMTKKEIPLKYREVMARQKTKEIQTIKKK